MMNSHILGQHLGELLLMHALGAVQAPAGEFRRKGLTSEGPMSIPSTSRQPSGVDNGPHETFFPEYVPKHRVRNRWQSALPPRPLRLIEHHRL